MKHNVSAKRTTYDMKLIALLADEYAEWLRILK